jgi:hypothetical protein
VWGGNLHVSGDIFVERLVYFGSHYEKLIFSVDETTDFFFLIWKQSSVRISGWTVLVVRNRPIPASGVWIEAIQHPLISLSCNY